jgi:uncharacterized protein (TIGR02145 family)
MKTIKIFTYISFFTFILGCSPNNENNDANVPPVPTNLTAQVISFTQINLSWVRNSTDYLQLNIERKTLTGTYEVIADIPSWDTNTTTFSDYGYGSPFTPNTTYVYRVCYVNPDGSNSAYSNECTVTTSIYPTITTTIPTLITANTASSGGIITDVNGLTITERGVVWSRIIQPQTQCNYCDRTIDGGGAGSFTSAVTGLGENITYYLKAYIKIANYGEIYGNEIAFTTLNYQTQNITICNQIWMQKNLNTSHYRNGDVIPQVTDQAQWEALTSGAWCYYNNDPSTGAVYGKLYNWYAMTDSRGLAPTGYHIPTETEIQAQTLCFGNNSGYGGKLKETGTTHWISPNTGATNETGFTALPGGRRGNAGPGFPGFQKLGTDGDFWLTSGGSGWPLGLLSLGNSSSIAWISGIGNANKNSGYSVRCIKD